MIVKSDYRSDRAFSILLSLLLGLLLFVSTAVLAAERPSWVDKKPYRPDAIQGFGIASDTGSPAEDKKRADNSALAEMAMQIRVTINSSLTSFYKEDVSESGEALTSSLLENITAQYAEETLEGVQIVDRYYDKKNRVYYSYALISREDLEKSFLKKARATERLCADYHRNAQSALAEGNVFGAIEDYKQALNELLIAQATLKEKLEGDLDGDREREMLQPRLEKEITGLINRIGFEKISGDKQHAVRGRGLEEPLVGRVFYRTDSSLRIPVASFGVRAKFINASGAEIPETTTDAGGLFSFNAGRIDSCADEIGLIRVGTTLGEQILFEDEWKQFADQIDRIGCTYEFTIDVVASVKVFVSIEEKINGKKVRPPYAKGRFIETLVGKKFTVIDAEKLSGAASGSDISSLVRSGDDQQLASLLRDEAKYAVVGVISSVTSDSVAQKYPIVYALADADIRVVDLKTGRVIAGKTLSQVKAAGGNGKNANRKAIKSCADKAAEQISEELLKALQ